MILSAHLILWIGLAILVVLVAIAAAHVIFAIRYANNDPHILVATVAFAILFTVITGSALILLPTVNWQGQWTIGSSTETTNTTPGP